MIFLLFCLSLFITICLYFLLRPIISLCAIFYSLFKTCNKLEARIARWKKSVQHIKVSTIHSEFVKIQIEDQDHGINPPEGLRNFDLPMYHHRHKTHQKMQVPQYKSQLNAKSTHDHSGSPFKNQISSSRTKMKLHHDLPSRDEFPQSSSYQSVFYC